MSPKHVLITGPFGSVGMSVIRNLVQRNAKLDEHNQIRITCIARPSKRSRRNEKFLRRELKGSNAFATVWADLLDEPKVIEAVLNQDAVIHLAAIIPTQAYEQPELARNVNVRATEILLRACSKLEHPPRVVYGSSYSVHGTRNPNKELPRLSASTPLSPQDAYSSQKAQSERKVQQYNGEWSILRIGAVANHPDDFFKTGPERSDSIHTLSFSIPANQRRHGVHYDDVAQACAECALTDKAVAGKTFMIGGDDSWCVTNSAFMAVMMRSMGIGVLPDSVFRVPSPEADSAYYYEDWMDTTESQNLLQFQNHTVIDYEKRLRAAVGSKRRAIKMLSPLIRRQLSKKSPYYKSNLRNQQHPYANYSMGEIMNTKPDPLWDAPFEQMVSSQTLVATA